VFDHLFGISFAVPELLLNVVIKAKCDVLAISAYPTERQLHVADLTVCNTCEHFAQKLQ
jgi:hypothetical protein